MRYLKKKQNNKLHCQLKATKNLVLETLNWGNRAVNESALMSLNWENGSLAKSYGKMSNVSLVQTPQVPVYVHAMHVRLVTS